MPPRAPGWPEKDSPRKKATANSGVEIKIGALRTHFVALFFRVFVRAKTPGTTLSLAGFFVPFIFIFSGTCENNAFFEKRVGFPALCAPPGAVNGLNMWP